MDNYKIIDVLRTLNTKELRRFGEFVESPYFNKNKKITALFKTFSAYHPDYRNRNLNIENIYKKVFPGAKYDYHKINNVISDLFKLAEQYFVISRLEEKEYYIERNIFEQLRSRNLYKIYEQKHAAYIKKLFNRKYKDEDYYFYLYEINDEYLWYATIKKPNTELNILQNEFDYFFNYALIRLLRFYNLMLHEQNQNNVKYKLTMLEEIMKFISEKNFSSSSINVFKTILLLLKTKDVKYYRQLWKLKEKHFEEFKFADQYLMFIHLYDYAAFMVNFKGDDSYNRDMFLIYKEMIEKRFMSPENFLYPNFMNVVKIACRVGEFDYAEKVIQDFKPSLPPAEKDNILAFCFGSIEYTRGNLRDALKHFSKANFSNFIFKVQVKILLLKIYYKLEMYEEAMGMIDTFRHFVTREENLLDEHRESYIIFLKLINDLIKAMHLSVEEKKYQFIKIKKEAGNIPANPFRIRLWLLEELKI